MEKPSANEQDAIAARSLAELADEEAWSARFAATTDGQRDRLAERAKREVAAGGTLTLDSVLPLSAPDR